MRCIKSQHPSALRRWRFHLGAACFRVTNKRHATRQLDTPSAANASMMRYPSSQALVCLVTIFTFVASARAEDGGTIADPSGTTGLSPRVSASPAPVATGVIRKITIQLRDVFEGDDLAYPYRAANSVKVNTRDEVVRRELLFREGDVFDQFIIDESARNLRTLPFLREVAITTTQDGNAVDVLIEVQDTWTLIPQVGFTSGGGQSRTTVGLAEGNVLGFGKRAELLFSDDEGRKKIEGVYDDRRLWGTPQRLLLGHFDRSDGFRTLGLWGRPFRSLLDKDSWQTYADVSDTVGKLFELGDERFIYRNKHTQVGASYTLSVGDPETERQRATVGYEYQRDLFGEADLQDFEDVDVNPASVSRDPNLLAEDRQFSGPFAQYELIQPDFVSSNYIDRFERVEDYNLGNEFSIRLQFASHALGSQNDTGLLSLNHRWGYRLGEQEFARFEVGASTRADNFGFDNNFVRSEAKYFNVLGPRTLLGLNVGVHTLASNLYVDYGADFDKDRELLLGAENGLRGYEDRTFSGSRRLVLNIEDRIHLVEDLFQLVNLGGVVFFDGGGTTRDEFGRIFANGFYTDVGVGLRIGFPRSQGGGMLRIDFAVPLRNGPDPDEDQRFEPRFFISTGQIFSARTRAETLGLDRANVTVGTDR